MANVVGWRIVKEKHAKSAFSGEGARIFEGRWNSAGVRMVYCSEHGEVYALGQPEHLGTRRQDPATGSHRLDRLQRRLEKMIHLSMFGHPSAENWFEVR